MSDLLSDWTTKVVETLEQGLPTLDIPGAWTVVRGERDGKSEDRKIACVFPGDWGLSDSVNWARPVLIVRAWLPTNRLPRKVVPRDPVLLNELQIAIHQLLAPADVQVLPDLDGGRGLYFFPTSTRQDRDDWGVEITLTGWCRNPATV